MRGVVAEYRPDIVHVQNVYPLISPSVLVACRRAGVPVVMTLQNYRLVCPSGLHQRNGRICEKCCGGREYWCVLHNCEESLPKSLGYALRNWIARLARLFRRNVAVYVCLTEFQKGRLVAEGFPPERLMVVPNMTEAADDLGAPVAARPYVGYAGRVSPEKGIDLLLEAARRNPGIPFRVAGAYDRMPGVVKEAPQNLSFLGPLAHQAMDEFYRASRMTVLCSTWFEGLPMVLIEAMMRGTPVVAPRIGGIPEVVAGGTTGYLFQPGEPSDLAEKIRQLWESPSLCEQMGKAARNKALAQYSPEPYYRRLMEVYDAARRSCFRPGWHATPVKT
jgi:glycosyltransferase involved in cell wall biosynthesis